MTVSSRANLIGASALLLWSSLALLTGGTTRVPPFQLVGMAFGLAALLAVARWIVRGESPLERMRHPLGAWALGVGGLFGYHFFYFVALRTAPAVEANLLNYLWPLLIVLFSALLPGERLTARHIGGGLLGLAGAALLVTGGGMARFDAQNLPGYAAALACAVLWSGYSVLNRRYREVPSDAVGGFCAATAVLALACHFLFEQTTWPNAAEWGIVLALGIGPLGAAFFLWDFGVKHGDIQALGTLAYATPLASTLLLIAFGDAEAGWAVAVAALLITGGAALGAGDLFKKAKVCTQ